MKIKRFFYCSAILFTVLLTAVSGFGAQEYTGIVVPTATSSSAFYLCTDIYGNYSYLARPGEIVTPQVSNSEGEIVERSNVILQMNMLYWNAILAKYKTIYNATEEDVKVAEVDLIRYKKLYRENDASSLETYQQAQIYYWNCIIARANAKSGYLRYVREVKRYTDIAPFEGMVTKDYGTIEQLTSGTPAVQLVQLNPIGIKVKMDRKTAKAIKNNTPVKIYPVNSDKAQGIIYGRTVLTENGIEFITVNTPVIEGTEVIQHSNPKVIRNWDPVLKFYVYRSPKVLSVPANSLVKEGDKHYVWKAKGQKTMQPDKTIDRYFKIEKVYVEPADLLRIVSNSEKKVALTECGGLELYDLVMINPQKDLVEGETILYPEGKYLLMPGDQVKVVVGDN